MSPQGIALAVGPRTNIANGSEREECSGYRGKVHTFRLSWWLRTHFGPFPSTKGSGVSRHSPWHSPTLVGAIEKWLELCYPGRVTRCAKHEKWSNFAKKELSFGSISIFPCALLSPSPQIKGVAQFPLVGVQDCKYPPPFGAVVDGKGRGWVGIFPWSLIWVSSLYLLFTPTHWLKECGAPAFPP